MKTFLFASAASLRPVLAASLVALPVFAADPASAPAATQPTAAAPVAPGLPPDSAELRQLLQRGLFEEEASRDFGKAAAAYSALLSQYDTQRTIAATALFRLAEIRVKQKDDAGAILLYRRLLAEFPGHETLAPLARERLAKLEPGAAGAIVKVATAGDAPTPEEAAELVRLREMASNSPDLLNAKMAYQEKFSRTPLENAAANGWVRAATFLLDQKISANGLNIEGLPLVEAARGGHKKVVELLLDRGAAINPPSDKSVAETALGTACSMGRVAVVKVLLARGADPNLVAGDKLTPLSRVLNGGFEVDALVRLLLDKGANPNLASSYPFGSAKLEQVPPLTQAVQRGDLALVKLLLEKGADPNSDPEFPRQLPLVFAVNSDRAEIVTLLLEDGAKPDVALSFTPDGSANRFLNYALIQHPKMARLLLEHGAPKNFTDGTGFTPLQVVIFNAFGRRSDAFYVRTPDDGPASVPQPQFLQPPRPVVPAPAQAVARPGVLAQRSNPPRTSSVVRSSGIAGQFPPAPTAEQVAELKAVCETLLTGPAPADINARFPKGDSGAGGKTALHFALQRTDLPVDFFRWLIGKGADLTIKDDRGRTPLDTAHLQNSLALEPELLFPKIARKDAITILTRTPGLRSMVPDRLTDTDPQQKAPAFVQIVRETFFPPTEPVDVAEQEEKGVVATFNARFTSWMELRVFRPDDKGAFAQVSSTDFDVLYPPKKDAWPELRWGDIVVFYATETTTPTTPSDLREWLEENGALKSETVKNDLVPKPPRPVLRGPIERPTPPEKPTIPTGR